MIGHLLYAVGAPCPTLVLDGRGLNGDGQLSHLTEVRRYLMSAGGAHVLKIALVRPSEHPMFDLDYQFVQALPDAPDSFDVRGSCGHSILAAVVAAGRMGMVAALTPGARIRVRVVSTDDQVVCQVDSVGHDETGFSVYFVRRDQSLRSLLIAGEPTTELSVGGRTREVSLISAGNPYVFVDARTLGVPDQDALFAAGAELFDELTLVRVAAAELLGWPVGRAFPKVAALLPSRPGEIAVRAVSVPSWHPTVALTGMVCLAAAVRVPGSVPRSMVGEPGPSLDIRSTGGVTTVLTDTREVDGVPAVGWTAIAGKRVVFQGSFVLEPLAHLHFEEISECLALSATSA
jgi:2-methylaconitate cis-trans-isomerase PrpF